jgi:hypothetical protein
MAHAMTRREFAAIAANLATLGLSSRNAVFDASWFGANMFDLGLNQSLRTNGAGAWFGWPKDDRLEGQ